MILSRQLPPGTRVTQAQLAEMLGVSTMPIREALLRLGAEGLITSSASRSFEIATVTGRGIRDVYWIHGVLAGELAARAWDHKSEELIGTLREEHKNYNAAHKAGDHAGLTDANRRFHRPAPTANVSPLTGHVSWTRNTLPGDTNSGLARVCMNLACGVGGSPAANRVQACGETIFTRMLHERPRTARHLPDANVGHVVAHEAGDALIEAL